MQTLARLFGRFPPSPRCRHTWRRLLFVFKRCPLFQALGSKNYELIETIAEKISKLEHDADLTKNDIRNHLPNGLFLPIERASLLEILSLQDNLADLAEDIAVLLTFRELEFLPSFSEEFHFFLKKNLETFEGAHTIIKEMGQLLESSFGGSEAEKVRKLVEDVAFKEHECDLLQRKLLKKMFHESDNLPPPVFFLWVKLSTKLPVFRMSQKGWPIEFV